MFTGIVEEIGIIKGIKKTSNAMKLDISAKTVINGAKIGASIATNGVCLTIAEFAADGFTADVMPETFARTNLKSLRAGSRVNLESALSISKNIDGHIVQGHVDGIAAIKGVKHDENSKIIKFETDDSLFKYIIPQGSIAIDGTSLTITKTDCPFFEISLIPTTQRDSVLALKGIGDEVNIECDVIGKYIANIIEKHFYGKFEDGNTAEEGKSAKMRITEEYLLSKGF